MKPDQSTDHTPPASETPRTDAAMPIPDALYPCKHCRDEYSWPADDLYWSEKTKAWVCSNCWDDEHDGEDRGIRLDKAIGRSLAAALAENARLKQEIEIIRMVGSFSMLEASRDAAIEIMEQTGRENEAMQAQLLTAQAAVAEMRTALEDTERELRLSHQNKRRVKEWNAAIKKAQAALSSTTLGQGWTPPDERKRLEAEVERLKLDRDAWHAVSDQKSEAIHKLTDAANSALAELEQLKTERASNARDVFNAMKRIETLEGVAKLLYDALWPESMADRPQANVVTAIAAYETLAPSSVAVAKKQDALIQSIPGHGVGDQQMNFRMAANAIWNKLNFGMSLVREEGQLMSLMSEARELADSIVHHPASGEVLQPAPVPAERQENQLTDEQKKSLIDNGLVNEKELLTPFEP